MLIPRTIGHGYNAWYPKLLFALFGNCQIGSIVTGRDEQKVRLRSFRLHENLGLSPVLVQNRRVRHVGYLLTTFLLLLYDSQLIIVTCGEVTDQVHSNSAR